MSEFNVQAALHQVLSAVREVRGCPWCADFGRDGSCQECLRRAESLLEDVLAELAEREGA